MRRCALHALAAALLGLAALAAPAAASADAPLPARVRAAVEAFVQERAAAGVTSVAVPELSAFDLPGVPPGRVEIGLSTRASGSLEGRVPVTVALSVAGREHKRGVVTARAKREARVWVAVRSLPRGHVVARKDLRRERRDLEEVRGRPVSSLDGLVGLQTSRHVSRDRVLTASLVERPPVVSRGDRVSLRLTSGPLRIEAPGEVREDARAGETVRVLNLSSRREVTGVVDARGVVHVRF